MTLGLRSRQPPIHVLHPRRLYATWLDATLRAPPLRKSPSRVSGRQRLPWLHQRSACVWSPRAPEVSRTMLPSSERTPPAMMIIEKGIAPAFSSMFKYFQVFFMVHRARCSQMQPSRTHLSILTPARLSSLACAMSSSPARSRLIRCIHK